MKQHVKDPTAIVLPRVVMAFKSQNGYHTFNCPACDRRNKVHEKRAINYLTPEKRKEMDKGTAFNYTWDTTLHFSCAGCHREVHVSRCPVGGLIVL